MAIVVGSEALEEGHDEAVRLGCSVSQLVPRPVVFTNRDENTLVDIEGCD